MDVNSKRRKFLKQATKGSLGLITLSVIPFSLAACSNDEKVDTSAMANLGPLDELKNVPSLKK